MKHKTSTNVLEVLIQQMAKCCKGQQYNLSVEAQNNGTVCLVWSSEDFTHKSEPLSFFALNMSHKSYNEALKVARKAIQSKSEV